MRGFARAWCGGAALMLALPGAAGSAAAAAQAEPTERQEAADADAYFLRVADELQGGPLRERLVARLLGGGGRDAAADAALLAEIAASQDPLALQLAAQAGIKSGDAALRDAAVRRWREREPDNLAPRLLAGAPAGELFAGAAPTRFDLHYYGQVRWLRETFARHPPRDEERRSDAARAYGTGAHATLLAFAVTAAHVLPDLRQVTDACRDEALAEAGRRGQCLRLAGALVEASDTLLGQSLGISLLERLADTPQARTEAGALHRRYAWHVQAGVPDTGSEQEELGEILRLLDAGIDSEPALVEARLRARGIALDPPTDWTAPTL